MGDYRKLRLFVVGHQLVLRIYQATSGFPDTERYGLVSQIRRAAVSIPSNVAEGVGRQSPRELCRFAAIARGSAKELDYLLKLSADLSYLDTTTCDALIASLEETCRMLTCLIRRTRGA